MTDISSRAQDVFREVFDQPTLNINPEMTAFDVDGWDSLSHIRLIVSLEKAFKIKFIASEVVAVQNVGELLDLIEEKLEAFA